jgi:hypothetical protein
MFNIELKIHGDILTTEFMLDGLPERWAREVLDCLRGKVIPVPDPAKEWPPPWDKDKIPKGNSGYEIYAWFRWWKIPRGWRMEQSHLAETEIPVLDWLPVVCGTVYLSEALWPGCSSPYGGYFDDSEPHPIKIAVKGLKRPMIDTLAGDILIISELEGYRDAFCFVLAHELLHRIHLLRQVYPALMNWDVFLRNVLGPHEFPSKFNRFDYFGKRYDMELDSANGDDLLERTFGPKVRKWSEGLKKFGAAARKGVKK